GLAAENGRLRAKLRLLQEAVENVRHGLCLFDDQGHIAYCNARYPEVIGLPPAKVRPGTHARELVRMAKDAGYYPADRTVDDLEAAFWRNLSDEGPSRAQIRRNGRTYVIHPGRTAEGNFV